MTAQEGTVTAWDIATMLSDQPEPPAPILQRKMANGMSVNPTKLIVDAIGSVQFHPFKPLVMASAGSRSMAVDVSGADSDSSDSDSDSDEDDSEDAESQEAEDLTTSRLPVKKSIRSSPLDDSLRIWSFA